MDTVIKKIREEIYNEHSFTLDQNKNMTMLVLMFDYYNFLCIRKQTIDITDFDKKFLSLLQTASFEEIFHLFKSDLYYACQALYDNYFFNILTSIEKQNLMYQLHFDNDSNALTNNALYKIDMISYWPSGKLEDMIKNYAEYVNNYSLDSSDIIEKIIFNLDILKKLDYDKYKNILLEIIYDYYKLDKVRIQQSNHFEIKNRMYHYLIKTLSDKNIIKYITNRENKLHEIVSLYFTSKFTMSNQAYQKTISEAESKMSKRLIKKFNNKKEN